jgi:uncharacterized protein YegP (UPF0339 family)
MKTSKLFATLCVRRSILCFRMHARQQFLVYQSNGKHHWKFVANGGDILAVSPDGYENEEDCLEAIDAIQDQAPAAAIVDRLFDPTPLAVVR